MDELSRMLDGSSGMMILLISIVVLGALILWVAAWIMLPFAVFGLKKRVDELIENQNSVMKKFDNMIISQNMIMTRLEWIIYATNKDSYKEFLVATKKDTQ